MSLRQRNPRPSLLSTLWGHRGQTRDRRRRHLGPIVTRLEERTLLTTPTLTTLADSATSLTYGQTEVFTATVTTDPHSGTTPTGGTVTFMDGTTTLGTKPLTNGMAQLSVSGLGVGSDEVTAIYSGTGAFGASSTPVTPSPVITTVAGGGNSAAKAAHYTLRLPAAAVAVDSSGDLFIAEGIGYYNGGVNEVCEVNHSTGAISIVAGNGSRGYSGDGGPATAAELSNPSGLALNGSGDLFIADSGNNVVREVNLNTGIITTVAGNGTADRTEPTSEVVNTGITTNVTGNGSAGYSGDGVPATTAEPSDVAADDPLNLITGIITTATGNGSGGYSGDGGPATAAELSYPSGVAVDDSGDLFIADSRQQCGPRGQPQHRDHHHHCWQRHAGRSAVTAARPPPPNCPVPSGLAVDGSGDLFIADSGNNVVREVNLNTGIITTIAGNGTAGYSGDGGPATAAELDLPLRRCGGRRGRPLHRRQRQQCDPRGQPQHRDHHHRRRQRHDGLSAATAARPPPPSCPSPSVVAVDGSGDLFIADWWQQCDPRGQPWHRDHQHRRGRRRDRLQRRWRSGHRRRAGRTRGRRRGRVGRPLHRRQRQQRDPRGQRPDRRHHHRRRQRHARATAATAVRPPPPNSPIPPASRWMAPATSSSPTAATTWSARSTLNTGIITTVAGNGTAGYQRRRRPGHRRRAVRPRRRRGGRLGRPVHRRQRQQRGPRGQSRHRDHHHRRG